MAIFRLVRWQNLLIIAAIFYFTRHFIIEPLYQFEKLNLTIDNTSFFFFVLGYLLLTAGGYAINDYYDIGIDEINRPNKVILRKYLPLSTGLYIYIILTVSGFIISAAVIFALDIHKLLFVLLIVTFLYWFYTTKYKREFLSGNLAVAFLAALAVGIVWLYEFFASVQKVNFPVLHIKSITIVTLTYSAFAFILTLVREIVKDVTDMKGDAAFQCQTIPLRFGIAKTKRILIFILSGAIVLMIYILTVLMEKKLMLLFYYSLFLLAFMIYIAYLILKARNDEDFKAISSALKVLFIAGVLSMQLFYMEIKT